MRTAWFVLAVGCGSSWTPPEEPTPDAAPSTIEDVVLVTAPGAIAVDEVHLFYTHGTTHGGTNLSRVPKPGGATTLLTSPARWPSSLDASTDQLCWVYSGTHAQDFLDGSVRCAPKSGGADVEISTAYFPSDLVVDGNTIYWTEIDGQSIRRIGMDGAGKQTLDMTPTHKREIAISADKLAWTASSDMADVVVMDRASGTKTPISSAEYSPGELIIDGNDIYWVVLRSLSGDGAIRVSRALGAPVDLAPNEEDPSQLVRIGDTLYWTSRSERIRAMSMTGGAATTIVEGRGKLGAIATDGTHLYWTEPDRGAIVRMPR